MAAGLLESEGIEAMVMADDAGGTYPMLQFIRGVRLMVFKEDEARAREILAAMAAGGGPRRRTLTFLLTIISSRTQRKMKMAGVGGAAVPGRHIGWRAGTPAPLHGGPPHRAIFI